MTAREARLKAAGHGALAIAYANAGDVSGSIAHARSAAAWARRARAILDVTFRARVVGVNFNVEGRRPW